MESNIVMSNMIGTIRWIRSESRNVAADLSVATFEAIGKQSRDPFADIIEHGVSFAAARRAVDGRFRQVGREHVLKSDREIVIDAILAEQ